MSKQRNRHLWVKLVLGLAVSAAFAFLAARGVEWSAFRDTLRSAAPGPLAAALSFLAAGYFLRLLRWHWMLRCVGATVSLSGCARPFLIGFALNNVLPFRAGDVVRAVGFRETIGASTPDIIGTLIAERFFDLLVLLGILAIGLALIPNGGAAAPAIRSLGLTAVAAAVVGLAVIATLAYGARRSREARSQGKRHVGSRLQGWLQRLGASLVVLGSHRRAVPLLTLSIGAWVMEGGVFFAAARALGLDDTGVWLALAAGTLGTLLPGSPGHLGTFDFFAMEGMVVFGAESSLAAAFAVLVHGLLWLPLTLAGLILFVAPRSKGAPDSRASVPNAENRP